MRALLCVDYGPIDMLAVRVSDRLPVGSGQVRVQIEAAALNYPDALIVQGLYQTKPKLPFIPGSEFAGIVVEVGEGVDCYRTGDRVVVVGGSGGFADEAVVDASRLMSLPHDVSFEHGACFTVTYGTALRGLRDSAGLKSGETLLVLGAGGGVGLAAVEIGRLLGARVIAAASSQEKLELCRSRGADALINYETENLRDRINEMTAGEGVSVVFDPVGGKYTEAAVRSIRWGGRLIVVGFASGEISKIPMNLLLLNERSVKGVFWGESVRRDSLGHEENMKVLWKWLSARAINPHISELINLEEVPEFLSKIVNRQASGKIVVSFNQRLAG